MPETETTILASTIRQCRHYTGM